MSIFRPAPLAAPVCTGLPRLLWTGAALALTLGATPLVGCNDDADRTNGAADPDAAADAGGDGSGGGAADGSSQPTDASGADAGGTDSGGPLPTDLDDGEGCVQDDQCASGTCLTTDDGFPGGFCTFIDCDSRRDCAGAGRACLRGEFNGNLCVELCEVDGDCREGYECVGEGGGSFCFPAYAGAALNPVCESEFLDADAVRAPFGSFEALDRHEITFTIDDDTTSFMLVAWNRSETVYPETFTAPDGTELDLVDYASYFFSPATFGTVAPVLFPGGPQFEDFVMPGEYTATFGFGGNEREQVCWILMQESESLEPAASDLVIDVNFYFVGVEGLSADTAPDSTAFRQMLAEFDNSYAGAGIALGDIRYYDVTGDVEAEYEVIRSQDAVFDLVQLSRQPGDRREDLLSTNVFFIRGFTGEMGGVLGVSAGIPGAAGVHGSQGTGLVFSADNLSGRGGPALVGQTLAHEVGHFIGLFHTSEQQGGGQDQLADTPSCDTRNTPLQSCPDAGNLMFPIALFRSFVELSDGQILIARANPLTKTVSRADVP
jgi:hypothetical protein